MAMSWTEHLKKAKLYLKSSRLDDSLKELNQALLVGGDREYTVHDARAALYERQGKFKNALQDVKNVIKLAPAHWQGYARASRLFLSAGKPDEATTMADMALSRLDPTDSMRRKKLIELKEEVLEHRRRQIYHFGKLPVEIITTIFEMIVVIDWSRVFTIWRVCKHWHNIALNTPNLWSTLILTNRHPARHAQRWIERSKGRIREISLRSTLSRFPVNLDGLFWSHLRICRLENHDIAEYIGGKSNLHRLSRLEELQVDGKSLICDPLLSIPESQLRRLILNGPPFSWQLLASNHRNLTSLEIRHPRTSPSLEELMAILESNPMLEQLVLDLDTIGATTTSSPPPPLTLSNLHTLHLVNTHWTPQFFALVTMPLLQTLRLSRIRAVGLTTLIEKRPPLLHLAVHSCIVPSSELLKLLDLTLTLKTLALTRLDAASNVVLEALVASGPSDATPLCPALTHLDLSHCPDVKTGRIVALLSSRNSRAELPSDIVDPLVPARIRTLIVDGCPQIEANSIPWIRTQVSTFSCIYLSKQAANWKR
ncbi:hypothetical protein C8R44DRAFT_433110 [Mycena epipterygia]|nr:hypothetical protein C8R44DRAFT_433110 [Mycena epipterygia]